MYVDLIELYKKVNIRAAERYTLMCVSVFVEHALINHAENIHKEHL